MNSSPIRLKQKLSPKAAAAKKRRDLVGNIVGSIAGSVIVTIPF